MLLSYYKNVPSIPSVVLTGHIHDNRNPEYSDIILQTIHKYGIAQQVYLLGLIPKLHQIQLLRRSLCVIQPSLFEGWSTLVEDARCFGKHLILSDLPVNLEQDPPNGQFFDRHSPESLADLMQKNWQDLVPGPDLEQEKLARSKNIDDVQKYGFRFLEIVKSAFST
jgi:glycosyltransferase involved in cell wall biosynthesis